jgi:hypothetical protein
MRKSNAMDDKAEKVAIFRYGLIAPLVLETLPRGEFTRRAQQIAGRLYDIPHSTRRLCLLTIVKQSRPSATYDSGRIRSICFQNSSRIPGMDGSASCSTNANVFTKTHRWVELGWNSKRFP